MKSKFWLPFFILTTVAVGCTTTQKAATTGGVIGTAAGGIIGHQSGHGVEGAAIGAAAGALGGYVIGDKMAVKKFCPQCGKVYDENAKFCPTDGTELKIQEK